MEEIIIYVILSLRMTQISNSL